MSAERKGSSAASSSTERADDARNDDSRRRTTARRVGLAAIALGFGVALAGPSSLPILGTDNRMGAVLVAAAAALLGLGFAVQPDVSRGSWWRPDDPEFGTTVPVPGESYADLSERDLKRRLRRRAVASLIDATGCSKETAETLVAEGRWTDDRLAAAYLGDAPGPSPIAWLRRRLLGGSADERAKRRTVAAIRAIREGEAVPRLEATEPSETANDADGEGSVR